MSEQSECRGGRQPAEAFVNFDLADLKQAVTDLERVRQDIGEATRLALEASLLSRRTTTTASWRWRKPLTETGASG